MFWERIATRLPLVEETDESDEVIVTFCWGDHDAEAVLLVAHGLTDETALEDTMLERLPGTDLWHASFRMSPDWRSSYSFVPHYAGQPAPWEVVEAPRGQEFLRAVLAHGYRDRRNTDVCRNRSGIDQSVVSLPDAPPQPWIARRPRARAGALTAVQGPQGRQMWIYDPVDVDLSEPLPAVVILDGEVWTSSQDLPTTLDNLIADGEVPPIRACLVASGGTEQRWGDHADREQGVRYLIGEVVPWLRIQRGIAGGVTLVGQSLAGLTVLRAGLQYPNTVYGVISQSASLWADGLADLIDASNPVRFHLAHGAQEWALAKPHETLAARMIDARLSVDAVVHNGGHDVAWWRGAIADGLCSLLGRDEVPHPRQVTE